METFFFFLIFSMLFITCMGILSKLTAIKNQLEHFAAQDLQAKQKTTTEEKPDPTEKEESQGDKDVQEVDLSSQEPFESEENRSLTAKSANSEEPIKPIQKEPSKTPEQRREQAQAIELRIGIRWAIVVGSITLLVGLLFLVKSAFGSFLSTPEGKITVMTLLGMIALLIGEFTRRKDYGFVAKVLTSLGFAILYTSVFSAYAYFEMIDVVPAFVLAICITVAAMIYAVSLDEVVMAFLALFGGFLSPLMLSIDQDKPYALFVYITILSLGAMACSIFRKWRAVNILSFVGTFLLYTAWYVEHYSAHQMGIAISWLTIFFIIFLIVPTLYELIKKKVTQKEAAILVLMNALVVLGYLAAMLYQNYSEYLAAAVVIMAISHFFMLLAITNRCPEDKNLPPVMLAIAFFCLTVAVLLYFKMYVAVTIFAAKAVVLGVIAAKYRSKITQIFSFVALGLAIIWVLNQLPLHTAGFRIITNTAFISWCSIATVFYFFHLIYRKVNATKIDIATDPNLPTVFYLCFLGILIFTAAMEWYYHLEINLNLSCGEVYLEYVFKAALVILTALIILLTARPFSPAGLLCKKLATFFAVAGAILSPLSIIQFHQSTFTIFINSDFVFVFIFVLALFTVAAMLELQKNELKRSVFFSHVNAIIALVILWVLLTEEIYLYWNLLAQEVADPTNYQFFGQMYISIMWAVYATGIMIVGLWRKVSLIRYISLALYTLILAKVFIFDMSAKMSGTYRIAGFIVLGLALIGVSYLYQFCKNKGLFTNALLEVRDMDALDDI